MIHPHWLAGAMPAIGAMTSASSGTHIGPLAVLRFVIMFAQPEGRRGQFDAAISGHFWHIVGRDYLVVLTRSVAIRDQTPHVVTWTPRISPAVRRISAAHAASPAAAVTPSGTRRSPLNMSGPDCGITYEFPPALKSAGSWGRHSITFSV